MRWIGNKMFNQYLTKRTHAQKVVNKFLITLLKIIFFYSKEDLLEEFAQYNNFIKNHILHTIRYTIRMKIQFLRRDFQYRKHFLTKTILTWTIDQISIWLADIFWTLFFVICDKCERHSSGEWGMLIIRSITKMYSE